MNHSIQNHRVFNTDDYERLKNKGYDDIEIIEIWDTDIKQRILFDLLWLAVKDLSTADNVITEFNRLKTINPFLSPNSNTNA